MKKILLTLLFSTQLNATVIADFELPIHGENKTFKIQEARGKTIVLNFFASWCLACIKEMPELNEMKTKNPDVLFVAINAGDTKEQIKKLLKKHPFSFTILEDSTKEVSKKLGVNELPRTMIIDPHGNITYSASQIPNLIPKNTK